MCAKTPVHHAYKSGNEWPPKPPVHHMRKKSGTSGHAREEEVGGEARLCTGTDTLVHYAHTIRKLNEWSGQ